VNRAYPRGSMCEVCGVITSSVIVAAMSKILNGSMCVSLPQARSVSVFYVNAT
jgi:hypothetical protein